MNKTKIEELNKIILKIKTAMDMEFENGNCISCKEMALACLEAVCEPQYRPDYFKDAIKLIITGGKQ